MTSIAGVMTCEGEEVNDGQLVGAKGRMGGGRIEGV